MRNSIHGLLISLILLSVTSCIKEIDLEDLRPAPKLVLNSVMAAGQPVSASVSRTWFYTEDKPNVTLSDADVFLYVDNKLQEQLVWQEGSSRYNSQGYYIATYLPRQGDRLQIIATVKGYQGVSAETVIPGPVPISQLDYKWEPESGSGYNAYNQVFRITFNDNPDRKDFYLINVEIRYPIWDEEKQVFTGEYAYKPAYHVDYTQEPLFTSSITALEKVMGYDWLSGNYGRVFTDDLINGQTYTLNLISSEYSAYYSFPGPSPYSDEYDNIPPHYYRITLYTISESYYRYMKSVIDLADGTMQSSLGESGLAEPVRVYSNVIGGTGILGGCNPDTKEIKAEPRPE